MKTIRHVAAMGPISTILKSVRTIFHFIFYSAVLLFQLILTYDSEPTMFFSSWRGVWREGGRGSREEEGEIVAVHFVAFLCQSRRH